MRIFTGKVISKKMAKTATVEVERIVAHALYKKRYKRTKKYQVHDELGTNVGDVVRFSPTKPFSKTKKWGLVEIMKKGKSKLSESKKP